MLAELLLFPEKELLMLISDELFINALLFTIIEFSCNLIFWVY